MRDQAVDLLIRKLATDGMPPWVVTLGAMAAISVVLSILRGGRSSAGPHATGGTDSAFPGSDPTRLSPDLRTVHVAGRSYDVEARFGQILTATTTTETGAPAAKNTQSTIGMRGIDGREENLTLTNTRLEPYAGQVVSLLLRRKNETQHDCLLAYANEPGQWIEVGLKPIQRAHEVPMFAAWATATVVGTFGGVWGLMAAFLAFANGRFPVRVDISTWVIALLVSALVARVLVAMAGFVIVTIRNGQFRSGYLGRYKTFFEQATPEVVKRLGGVGGTVEGKRAAASGG